MLTVIDEFSRKCLAIKVGSSLKSDDVIATLTELFTTEGLPDYRRSDNGAEFTSGMVRNWLASLSVTTAYITPGSPWENGWMLSMGIRARPYDCKLDIPCLL